MSLWLGISFLETLSSGALPDKNKEEKKGIYPLLYEGKSWMLQHREDKR